MTLWFPWGFCHPQDHKRKIFIEHEMFTSSHSVTKQSLLLPQHCTDPKNFWSLDLLFSHTSRYPGDLELFESNLHQTKCKFQEITLSWWDPDGSCCAAALARAVIFVKNVCFQPVPTDPLCQHNSEKAIWGKIFICCSLGNIWFWLDFIRLHFHHLLCVH